MSRDEQLAEIKAHVAALDAAPQHSQEWFYARVGRATCSRFEDCINFRKDKKESAKRHDYRMELVIERLTGQPSEHYVSDYMLWGSEQEAAARMAYEAHSGNLVLVPGFIDHPTLPMCGGSPDGLVDDDGLIEVKAPTSATHIETLLTEECEHLPQIQGNLWVTGRKWCDFISYDPRLPAHLQLYVRRIERDEKYIAELAAGVTKFLREVDGMMLRLAPPTTEEEEGL